MYPIPLANLCQAHRLLTVGVYDRRTFKKTPSLAQEKFLLLTGAFYGMTPTTQFSSPLGIVLIEKSKIDERSGHNDRSCPDPHLDLSL
jgi:hypothetical protein